MVDPKSIYQGQKGSRYYVDTRFPPVNGHIFSIDMLSDRLQLSSNSCTSLTSVKLFLTSSMLDCLMFLYCTLESRLYRFYDVLHLLITLYVFSLFYEPEPKEQALLHPCNSITPCLLSEFDWISFCVWNEESTLFNFCSLAFDIFITSSKL